MTSLKKDNLIETLIKEGYLKTPRIIEAFKKIDRFDFVIDYLKSEAYLNAPLGIGFGQTISQPLTVAFMLEHLQPQKGDIVLDVGTGSGWQAAMIAYIVGEKGRVIGIERIPQLVQFARANVEKYNFPQLSILFGDGTKGMPEEAPFDKIIVAAASNDDVPTDLVRQLAQGGKLLIPIGEWDQELLLLSKDKNNKLSRAMFPGFQFVPLIRGDQNLHIV